MDILSREPKREILEIELMTNQRHYPRSNLSFVHHVSLRRLANVPHQWRAANTPANHEAAIPRVHCMRLAANAGCHRRPHSSANRFSMCMPKNALNCQAELAIVRASLSVTLCSAPVL